MLLYCRCCQGLPLPWATIFGLLGVESNNKTKAKQNLNMHGAGCGFYQNVYFFLRFVLMTIFKVFIEFVTIFLPFHVLVFWPWGMWDLNSLTRDQTCTPGIGRRSPNHWTAREVPRMSFNVYIFERIFRNPLLISLLHFCVKVKNLGSEKICWYQMMFPGLVCRIRCDFFKLQPFLMGPWEMS